MVGLISAAILGGFVAGSAFDVEKIINTQETNDREALIDISNQLAYALESYIFRGKTFELGSECAELLVTYLDAEYYDIFTKAPALMKFDKTCNPQAP